jgi:serine/threonine protein kinase
MSFCGTAEYLAPEVLLGEPYSYEVDVYAAGTMLYEMLAGVTPFYASDHASSQSFRLAFSARSPSRVRCPC